MCWRESFRNTVNNFKLVCFQVINGNHRLTFPNVLLTPFIFVFISVFLIIFTQFKIFYPIKFQSIKYNLVIIVFIYQILRTFSDDSGSLFKLAVIKHLTLFSFLTSATYANLEESDDQTNEPKQAVYDLSIILTKRYFLIDFKVFTWILVNFRMIIQFCQINIWNPNIIFPNLEMTQQT